MLIATGPARTLGTDSPRLVFGEEAKLAGSWAGRRLLQLDGSPAFELSYWCGTCQFLFRRLDGATQTVSLADVEGTLRDGIDAIDDEVARRFGALLPTGTYLPILLEVQAASETGDPITLLSLLAVDASLAGPGQIDTAIHVRQRPEALRPKA